MATNVEATPVSKRWFWGWMKRTALLALALFSLLEPAAAQNCGSPANAIVAENCLAGNPPSEWDIVGTGSASIQGFPTQMSVNKGWTISFKVDTPASDYRIDIYRIG